MTAPGSSTDISGDGGGDDDGAFTAAPSLNPTPDYNVHKSRATTVALSLIKLKMLRQIM